MRRLIIPALLVLTCAVPSEAQYYGGRGDATRIVSDWYQRYLGRRADPQAANWIEALRSGEDPDQVLSNILGSDEYYIRAGRNPNRFVRRLFSDLGGHTPTAREVQYWTSQVYYRSRADVSYEILKRHSQGFDDDLDWRERYDYRRPLRYR